MIDPAHPDFTNTPVSDKRPVFGYALEKMYEKPAVSIITPFYNAGKEFHETARSVLGQSLQTFEWVIVNDASLDAVSLEILSKYRTGDDRIKVIDHQTNKGPGAARNTGVAASRAPHLYFLDADDLIEPTTLEKSLWFLTSFPEYKFVNGWSVGLGAQEYLWKKGFHHCEEFLQSNLATGRAMITCDAFVKAGGYDESITGGLEDWDFWLRCANQGIWGATIPEFLDWYRRRKDHSSRWSNWDSSRRQKQFGKDLQKKYPSPYAGDFPRMASAVVAPNQGLPFERSRLNSLAKKKQRLLVVVPGVSSNDLNDPALDFARDLPRADWEITIVVTDDCDSSTASIPAQITPDAFVLRNFLRTSQYYWFLQHLAESRRPDLVLLLDEDFAGFAISQLRKVCPEGVCLDPAESAELCRQTREDAIEQTSRIVKHEAKISSQGAFSAKAEDPRTLFDEYLSKKDPIPGAHSALYRPLSVEESIVEEIDTLKNSLTWRAYHAVFPNSPAAKALNDPELPPLDKFLRIKASKFYSVLKIARKLLPDRLARPTGD